MSGIVLPDVRLFFDRETTACRGAHAQRDSVGVADRDVAADSDVGGDTISNALGSAYYNDHCYGSPDVCNAGSDGDGHTGGGADRHGESDRSSPIDGHAYGRGESQDLSLQHSRAFWPGL